jgi:circadian clock protein KaiC
VSKTTLSSVMDTPEGPEFPKAPTGIRGFDQITGGGLPRGRVALVAGRAGAGKTLLGLEFLVAGARDYGEPGVLVTFEESEDKVTQNVRSLGFDLDALKQAGLLVVVSFRVDPSEVTVVGRFDLEPLFVTLDEAIGRIGARRVVLDTIEVLFGVFGDDSVLRAELGRLARWLEERSVTAVVTGERGENSLTRHGIEEYVSDCVILLDHRVRNEISTRRLQVVKYRGSVHGTNEYPFVITARGFMVLPITSIALDYDAPEDRVSTGIARLDHMLGGGLFRGSNVLVTGTAGTGKSALGAHLVDAAGQRGERALLISFEESPAQILRNMRSIGLDLRKWQELGLLSIWAARPSLFGLESHLASLAAMIEERAPSVAVLDGITSLSHGVPQSEATAMLARQFDMLKARSITTLATALGHDDETSTVDVASMADTWLLLRNTEINGERNRLLFVLKSRGMAHSNQVREFVLSSDGVQLLDVYVGNEGVLTGSARLAQEAARSAAAARQVERVDQRRRELHRAVAEHGARLAILQDQIADLRDEIDRLDRGEDDLTTVAVTDRQAMAAARWADADAGTRDAIGERLPPPRGAPVPRDADPAGRGSPSGGAR